jgi:hypothetical protein
MRRTPLVLTALSLAIAFAAPLASQDRESRVRKDLEDIVAGGKWFYNDLERGIEDAKKSGKPILAVLRCIPCEACRGFDEQVASFDPRVRELLERFVRVRIPQGNGLDLALFQFDYDLSFYAFFLNADRTIYGRFGTRSTQEDKKGDVSIAAFREAMEAVLDLHARYGEVKASLKAKTGSALEHKRPEEYPSLKGKYGPAIDYEKKPVQSCIHCHQIRDAERLIYRGAKKPVPDKVLYPWPLPDVFGLFLDPTKRATVNGVLDGSAAQAGGFRVGDELAALQGQPLVSIADVEWVLHNAGDEGTLEARVRRGAEEKTLKIPLTPGWRRKSDISWRVSSWELRRMGTGGLLLEELPADERRRAGIADDSLALRVKHAGEYGDHATAKNAGVRNGDVIVAIDGSSARMRETDVLAYSVREKAPGDTIRLSILRGQEKKEIRFSLK